MKKKNNTLTKLAILAGGALVLNEAAKATDRSANLPTQSVSKESETIKNEVIKELTKLIQDDVKIQSLLKPNNGLNGTDGKDGIVILAKTEENQNQITTSILSGDAIVVLNQHNKLAADGMTGMAINQIIKVDPEKETIISFYISPSFSQQSVNYLPTIQDLEGNILTGEGGEFSEMITEAECFAQIGGYLILKVNEGGELEIVQYPKGIPQSHITQFNTTAATATVTEINSDQIIILNEKSFFLADGVTPNQTLKVSDNVTKIIFIVTPQLFSSPTWCMPKVVNSNNVEVNYYGTTSNTSFNRSDFKAFNAGNLIVYKKVNSTTWFYEGIRSTTFVNKNSTVLASDIQTGTQEVFAMQGSADISLNIGAIKSSLHKNVIYTVVNELASTKVVTVAFGEVPHNYTTATSIVVKRHDASVSITPETTEFKGSLRFYLNYANKFVIL